MASGAHKFSGAEADVKIGIIPYPDGSFPPADETQGIMRGECKNRAATPDRYWTEFDKDDLVVVMSTKAGQEQLWKDIRQSQANRVLALRRPKVPQGALKNGQWDDVQGVFMPITVFADLLKRAYPERVFHIPEFEMKEAT